MKEKWQAPKIFIERFTPNDYIASSCGKTVDGKYLFKCDAPAGTLYYYPTGRGEEITLFGISFGYEGASPVGGITRARTYHPCNATHETDNYSDFYDGFVDYNGNRHEDDGEAVMVWTDHGTDGHATKTLGREQWTITRS